MLYPLSYERPCCPTSVEGPGQTTLLVEPHRVRSAVRLLLAVLLLAALAPGSPAADGTTPALRLTGAEQLTPRLRELTFETPALAGPGMVRVLLPPGYDEPRNRDRRYPVLYLLHGGTGSWVDWTEQGDAEALTAAGPEMIVVMPDGGPDGNYVDWYNHGAGGPPMWETFHIRQLLPWIDANLRTIPTRAQRAIAGLSMGGAGASHYAARHPDLFSAMAAWSGAVDTNDLFVIPVTSTGGLQQGKPPGSVYGFRQTDEMRWRADNATDIAENLAAVPTLVVATGNGEPSNEHGCTYPDPVEMDVRNQSVSFHTRLEELSIPHVWDDYGPGCHSWPYWQRELTDLLPILRQHFASNVVETPASFTFKAGEPDYEVFGWTVHVERPAMEWSTLEVLAPNRFRITGSGTAHVTPPGRTEAIVVDLGPGNPFQAYTAPALVTGNPQTTREVTF
jgi:S-formylglutathione hydrolase FrmB